MISFYTRPAAIEEAVHLRAELEGSQYLAGGTDILVDEYNNDEFDRKLIDVSSLKCLRELDLETGELGALTTFSDLLRLEKPGSELQLLKETAGHMAATQIRNRATLGGNICNGSPSADSLPSLLVLEARVIFQDREGEKEWPLSRFIQEKRQRPLEALLKKIRLGALPEGAGAAFAKVGRRSSLSIARMNTCGMLLLDGDLVKEARISLGAVAPTARRFPQTEKFLIGKRCCEDLWRFAGEIVCEEMEPFVHGRPSASYKIPVARDLITELLEVCCRRCNGGDI